MKESLLELAALRATEGETTGAAAALEASHSVSCKSLVLHNSSHVLKPVRYIHIHIYIYIYDVLFGFMIH